MPLKPGHDPDTIEANTQELIRSGYEPDQASAIAHAHAEVHKRKAESGGGYGG